ncbi:acid protease [Mycena alexandri]|uniref:Acid protease n=1 Tax=Mycena alexandri TaxID=1745969 RepID=A0AAD6RWH3_9AGAR|nr:acid protease [Mycena alexandri]
MHPLSISLLLASGCLPLVSSEPVAAPHTIRIQSRVAPKEATLRRRALSPLPFLLQISFWEQTSSGLETYLLARRLRIPRHSSTKTTSSITFSTGVGVDPVIGSNYKLTLRAGTDTVTVGGLSAPNVALNLITSQTAKFAIDPFSGIQGMSARAQGFFAALTKQGLPSLFSLYLTPEAIGGAELTIGGIDETKFNGTLTYADQSDEGSSTWTLTSPSISVNGKTTSTLKQSRDVIFDSGTSNILFDTATTEAIYALISSKIKAHTSEPGTYGIACSLIPTLPAVIDIGFVDQSGKPFNLTIPSSELSVGPFADSPSTCQTLINAFDGLSLVGGSVLKHYYSVWDVGAQRIGFAAI